MSATKGNFAQVWKATYSNNSIENGNGNGKNSKRARSYARRIWMFQGKSVFKLTMSVIWCTQRTENRTDCLSPGQPFFPPSSPGLGVPWLLNTHRILRLSFLAGLVSFVSQVQLFGLPEDPHIAHGQSDLLHPRSQRLGQLPALCRAKRVHIVESTKLHRITGLIYNPRSTKLQSEGVRVSERGRCQNTQPSFTRLGATQ
ncbi:hypothetical protein RRG08_056187 [Elysia crispata]|uniref:Uncharacterized protein n=1 Tax=Elysia crispata TaxID=231223 RepID=A0AAE0Z0P7_9GAST|nr:hypothetical protein RRG08_056187 [Elysia crispata]